MPDSSLCTRVRGKGILGTSQVRRSEKLGCRVFNSEGVAYLAQCSGPCHMPQGSSQEQRDSHRSDRGGAKGGHCRRYPWLLRACRIPSYGSPTMKRAVGRHRPAGGAPPTFGAAREQPESAHCSGSCQEPQTSPGFVSTRLPSSGYKSV